MEIIHLENGLSFQVDKINLTAKAISSPKAKGDIFYPRSILYNSQEYLITSIGENTFKDNYCIYSINFSEDSELRTICRKAFAYCSVESITIPSKVEVIGDGCCLKSTNLKHVYISPANKNFKYLDEKGRIIIGKTDPNSEIYDSIYFAIDHIRILTIPSEITEIRPYAFSNCIPQQICFEKNSKLKRIGYKAFTQIPLKSIEIPPSVETLEDGCFSQRYNDLQITIHPENKFYKALNNNSLIVGKSNPNEEEFDEIVFANNKMFEITIPSSIKKINSYAFFYCKLLTKVEFENNSQLTTIGKNAFSYNSIECIKIPDTVTKIGKKAFSLCQSLKKIDFGVNSKLKIIPKFMFDFIEIENFTIPMNVEKIEDGWNGGEFKLKDISISSGNHNFSYLDKENKIIVGKSNLNSEEFDVLVYAKRDIQKVFIPSNIKYIKSYAFEGCENLQVVEFSEDSNIVTFGESAFQGCSSLQMIQIPSTLKNIGSRCFFSCNNLNKIEIPPDSKLESIGLYTFFRNPFESLFIPPKLKFLPDFWQSNLMNLVNISISPENDNFKYLDEEHKIIVGRSELTNDFDVIVLSCTDIKKVFIPKTIKHISPNSFSLCQNLKEIKFSSDSQLTTIGSNSFIQNNIESIKFPSHVKFISRQCFSLCQNLKKIEFEKNSEITKIGSFTFNCPNVESFMIPAKLQSLKEGWCFNLKKLKEVTISPENVNFSYIDESHKMIACKSDINSNSYDILVFVNRNVREITIPESIKIIGSNALSYSNIEKVFVTKNVEIIGLNAFYQCNYLKYIEFDHSSELNEFSLNAVAFSSIRRLFFPEKLKEFNTSQLIGCNKLYGIEFLADEINISGSFYFRKRLIFSFPNAKKLIFYGSEIFLFDTDTIFFMPFNTKVELIK